MLINLDDGARYLGLQPSTLRRWVYEKRIAYVKLGRRVLFRKEILDELIKNSERPITRNAAVAEINAVFEFALGFVESLYRSAILISFV